MKFIDKCIKDGWTSKEIREIDELNGDVFTQMLADSMEEYEKTELRNKKLEQLNENNGW